MKVAVLGGAASVWRDLDAAKALASFDAIVAVNHAGRDYRGQVDHWATFHPELFTTWIEQRRAAGLSDDGAHWTVDGRRAVRGLPMRSVSARGGSSGMIGRDVAEAIGGTRIVLCGIPLEAEGEHFDRTGAWCEAMQHRWAWEVRAAELRETTRSMGGWTAQLLGKPTTEWLGL